MNLGLRTKSALALLACISIALLLSVAIGARAISAIEDNLGRAFARNITRYNKQRILAPVMRELALSQRLADSELTRQWLADENNPEKRDRFFAEAERYRMAFDDKSYFIISARSNHYYFHDAAHKLSKQPRYTLKKGEKTDAWFFNTLKNSATFNINVDPDVKLKLTKVWFNVIVEDGSKRLGLAGTGLDLTRFLTRFITSEEAGVTPMVLNREGAIQAHPNHKLIDYSSVDDKGDKHMTIYRLLSDQASVRKMRQALAKAEDSSDSIQLFNAELNGHEELLAVSYIPELKWHVVTAVDLRAARVLDTDLWRTPTLIGVMLLLVLVGAIVFAVNQILLTPLIKLTDSVRAMGKGNYSVQLPPASNDELGELTRAFGSMASQVQSHTKELEAKVRERTHDLTVVNEQMAAANKQISDSIQYASLIQNAILPNHLLDQTLGNRYFVWWRPRDVVGGDFYVFRAMEHGCLLGVIDCAGHGVPGAFMTMLAYASINRSIDSLGIEDPAQLLKQLDSQVRTMLHTDTHHSHLATTMDAGLTYVDFQTRTMTFAGAKVSLYGCDGKSVTETKGERFTIGGKKVPEFINQTVSLDGNSTYYLTTDGLLDQAGGPKGFGYGNGRFADLLLQHANRPVEAQRQAFIDALRAYQGELAQRDDITVLSFRFA